jgi:hypothetical protein
LDWPANRGIMADATAHRLHLADVLAEEPLGAELAGGGASALGFGFDRVPPALVDAADEHAFPVFTVPYETPSRTS